MSTRILPNGFKTTIAIDGIAALFEPVDITPPSLMADDAVEQTNMITNNWRGFLGGALLTMGDVSITVHYSVAAFNQIRDILRQNRAVTIRFPDGSNLLVYCIIQGFEPSALTINEKPTATLTLKPSNLTTSNPPAEFGYAYTTGTTTTVAP
jgi:hypothetical protein